MEKLNSNRTASECPTTYRKLKNIFLMSDMWATLVIRVNYSGISM